MGTVVKNVFSYLDTKKLRLFQLLGHISAAVSPSRPWHSLYYVLSKLPAFASSAEPQRFTSGQTANSLQSNHIRTRWWSWVMIGWYPFHAEHTPTYHISLTVKGLQWVLKCDLSQGKSGTIQGCFHLYMPIFCQWSWNSHQWAYPNCAVISNTNMSIMATYYKPL